MEILLRVSFPLVLVLSLAAQGKPGPEKAERAEKAAAAQTPEQDRARVEKLIQEGLAAWRAGDAAKAAEQLQKAVGLIQQQAAKSLATFLPTAVEGWTLEEPRIDAGTWGAGEQSMQWSNAELQLSREKDGAEARIQITNSPQLFQGFQGMVQVQEQMKELLRQQGQDVQIDERAGFKVVTTVQEGQATALAVGKSVAVFVDLQNGKREALQQVLGAVDLDGLAKLDRRK